MIIDRQNQYSSAQALTGTSATASTDLIDHGADRDLGKGEPLAVFISIGTALAGSATETLTVVLQADDNSSFSSAATVCTSPAYSEAQCVAGALLVLPIPPGTEIERYTRLQYTMAGTSPTCTLSAWLAPLSFAHTYGAFADAITIQ